ncbi:MCE family protein [Amycolatopsis acidicola]|uniref:MCE family protein n=1 Tax=Amycolatopsis acidicola TaxID=2596893 RepID=A0A5N0UUS7_9PSEU|nr:MCE family protein [Amycolatopsis acidicola]KAA9152312.1 MCE family protein [Amycolatopsis acidicola]
MTSERAEKIRYRLLGLALLVVVALFVAATIAVYRKAFTPSAEVTLRTDHVGSQLAPGADVKVRGLIVGRVSSIGSSGDGAVLTLELDPAQVGLLPANVTARLLPKTLFGERYVDLELPADPAPAALGDGATIDEDRSSSAIEVQQVLADLMPVLQAVQPDKLAGTLSSINTALSGRGEQLGRTLVQLNDYLKQVNPSLPDLSADFAGLAQVSDTYTDAAPQLLSALSDLTTTSRTITEQAGNLRQLYANVTGASADLRDFLRANENNLIDLVSSAGPALDVLARYAPEYPCMLKQLADQIPATDRAYGKGTAHTNSAQITLLITAGRGKYRPGVDTPSYEDDRGPRCYQELQPGQRANQYPADGPLQDGSTHPPARNGAGYVTLSNQPRSTANSDAERDLVATLVAPDLGVAPEDVPGWASVLLAPLFRGAEVTVK